MWSDDPAVDEFAIRRRGTDGAKIVLVVDADLGEPFSAAGAEVAHFKDGAWHGTINLARKRGNGQQLRKTNGSPSTGPGVVSCAGVRVPDFWGHLRRVGIGPRMDTDGHGSKLMERFLKHVMV